VDKMMALFTERELVRGREIDDVRAVSRDHGLKIDLLHKRVTDHTGADFNDHTLIRSECSVRHTALLYWLLGAVLIVLMGVIAAAVSIINQLHSLSSRLG
jgi:hypothetical protein